MSRTFMLHNAVVVTFFLATATVSAQTFSSTDTPIAIPPIGTAGTTISNITVGGAGTLTDVNVNVDYNHTFNGDLDAVVTSPAGTSVTLFDSVGGADDAIDGGYLFDDSAATAFDPTALGTYLPQDSLTAFNGEDPNGTWTLTFNDNFGGDSGTLNLWQLILTASMSGDASGAGIIPTLPLVEIQSNSRFLETLARRFRNGGYVNPHGPFASNTTGPGSSRTGSGYTQLASFSSVEELFDSEMSIVRGQNCDCPNERRAWFVGYGAGGNFDSSFDYDFSGFATGVEHVFDNNTVAGVALNYSASNVDGSISGSDTDSWGFALFGNRHFDAGYLTGVIAYNHSDYNMNRQTATGRATGDFTGHSLLSLLEIGTSRRLRRWQATPHLGLQHIHVDLDSFTETGAGVSNLQYGDDNIDSTRLIAGADLTRRYCRRRATLIPVLRAAYIQELNNDNRVVSPAFTGGGGPVVLQGARLGNEFGNVGIGTTMVVGERLTLYADYDFQFTRLHSQHLLGGGLSVNY